MFIFEITILWWVVGSFIAAFICMDKEEGFFGTLIISLLFTPAVGLICAFCSGTKHKAKQTDYLLDQIKKQTELIQAINDKIKS